MKNNLLLRLETMITKVRIKNFKCFNAQGVDIELAPLTFLFGDNSAGKSTVMQAISAVANMEEKDGLLNPKVFEKLSYMRDVESKVEIWHKLMLDGVEVVRTTTLWMNDGRIKKSDVFTPSEKEQDVINYLKNSYEHKTALRPLSTEDEARKQKSTLNTAFIETISLEEGVKARVNDMLSLMGLPYQIINNAYLLDTSLGIEVDFKDVGAGIHSLVDDLIRLAKIDDGDTLSLEEPELHLNPKQLAPLAKVLVRRLKEVPNSRFIIECHSEHMLLQIANLVKNNAKVENDITLSEDDVAVYQILRKGTFSTINRVKINEYGVIIDWAGPFFPERGNIIAEGWQ